MAAAKHLLPFDRKKLNCVDLPQIVTTSGDRVLKIEMRSISNFLSGEKQEVYKCYFKNDDCLLKTEDLFFEVDVQKYYIQVTEYGLGDCYDTLEGCIEFSPIDGNVDTSIAEVTIYNGQIIESKTVFSYN